MSQIRRKKVKLSPEEFNAKLDYLDSKKIKYTIANNGVNIHCKTKKTDYVASLTGEVAYEPCVVTISKQFHEQTGYHYLEEFISEEEQHPFGYRLCKRSDGTFAVKWDYITAGGTSYINEYYIGMNLKVWAYDVNSSYGYAMLRPMPDTRQEPRYNGIVNNGEIGFFYKGGASTKLGVHADIIFPLMDSPFKKYVYDNYKLKKEAPKDSVERIIAKYALNIPTGCVQRHNIFLRNAIIHYANEYIKKYIDENTVYCNVDSIYSLIPRPDIPTGEDIGQFKLEHECTNFKFLGVGMYQVEDECHYRGVPSVLIGDITKIGDAKDRLSLLKYRFNELTERFEINEN